MALTAPTAFPSPYSGATIPSYVTDVEVNKATLAQFAWTAVQAATASTTAVHAAITDTGVAVEVTTSITAPPCPRNITATSGGTGADIGAIQVTIHGTDYADAVIQETLPVFTANSATTVVGSKAFKTVTQIDIPAHDGTAATTAIGFGDKLGLPVPLVRNTIIKTFLGNTLEGTAATLAYSGTVLSSNTLDLNSALNGTVVHCYAMVP